MEHLNEEHLPEETQQTVGEIEKVAELEKTEVSKTESNGKVLMTVGDGSIQPGHNMETMTVVLTSAASAGQHAPSPRVKVKIEYPKGWKGSKHFKDGDIREVAPETADLFIQAGIASKVNQDKPE